MQKYTVTFTCQSGAKARIRTVVKLMGGEDIRIIETEIVATDTKPPKDNTPTSEDARAVSTLFGRSHTQPWSDAEIALFKTARKTGAFTTENMKLISDYYKRERAKGEDGRHRRDLPTFLRNAGGEMDRAKAVKGAGSRALEWTDSTANIVALPDPVEADRIRAEAKAGLEKFRKEAM